MFEPIERKVRNIQSSDEATKRRWFFTTSIILGFFVVVVWVTILRATISTPGIVGEATSSDIKTEETSSITRTLGKGVGVVYDDAVLLVRNFLNLASTQIKNVLGSISSDGKEITITPTESIFNPNASEPVSPTPITH